MTGVMGAEWGGVDAVTMQALMQVSALSDLSKVIQAILE